MTDLELFLGISHNKNNSTNMVVVQVLLKCFTVSTAKTICQSSLWTKNL